MQYIVVTNNSRGGGANANTSEVLLISSKNRLVLRAMNENKRNPPTATHTYTAHSR